MKTISFILVCIVFFKIEVNANHIVGTANGGFKIVNTAKSSVNNIIVKNFNKNGLLINELNTMCNTDINSEELPDDIYLLQIIENQKIVKSLKLIVIH